MKKLILILALLAGPVSAGGIPVIDSANLAQAIQQVTAWAEQYRQMEQQIEAITGSRGLGSILNNPALRDYLPADWQRVYDDLRSRGYEGLSATAEAMRERVKVYDGCMHITADEQRTGCEAQAVKPIQDKVFLLEAYGAARERLVQIEGLMAEINATTDSKAIAELQGRIAAEQAMIENEKIKLGLYQQLAAAEKRIYRQQEHERVMRDAAKRGHLDIQPMTFSIR